MLNEKKISKYAPNFYLVFRVLIGLMFAIHGAQKFGLIGDGAISGFAGAFGFPVWLAAIVALIELVGGIAILIGFKTRIAAFLGAIVVLVAYLMAHFPTNLNIIGNGGEAALLYLVAFLVLMGYGGGKASLSKN
ncbi:DoxX family protein [archaeon]|jgi:putative oxidoreductase|nr:DoxX family protein [archaeon]